MPPGKLAAQAGHAFLGAFTEASKQQPETAQQYADDPPGTKVVLGAHNLDELLWIKSLAEFEGIPCSLITDSGHVLPPHFDGSPVVTALGLGPATRKGVANLIRRLSLV